MVVAPLGGCDQGDRAVKYPTLPLWVTVIRVMELSGIAPCPHWVTVIRVVELSSTSPCPLWVTVIRVMERWGTAPCRLLVSGDGRSGRSRRLLT